MASLSPRGQSPLLPPPPSTLLYLSPFCLYLAFSRPDSSQSFPSASTRPCSEIFCPLLPHPVPARHRHRRRHRRGLPRPRRVAAAATRKSHNKPVDFSPVTPYTPYTPYTSCVRGASVCSKGQRPTLTTRHGSTRIVRANTQKSGLFWFPGRYPDSPLLSPVTSTLLSLSAFPFFLSSLFAHSRVLAFSLSLPASFLSHAAARIYPYVRETHRRVERRRSPKMGIESREPVTSGCVHGTVHREYRYLQTRGNDNLCKQSLY